MATILGEQAIQNLRFHNPTKKPIEVSLYRKKQSDVLLQFTVGAGATFNWDANPGGELITNGYPLYLNTKPIRKVMVTHKNGIIEAAVEQTGAAFVGENDPYRCGTTTAGAQCTKPLGHKGYHNYYAVHSPDEQGVSPEPQDENEWYEPCDDPTENWLSDEPIEPPQVSVNDIGESVILTGKLPTGKINLTGTWKPASEVVRTTGIAHTQETTNDKTP